MDEKFEAFERRLKDLSDKWRESGTNKTLREWLKMSYEEYDIWLNDPYAYYLMKKKKVRQFVGKLWHRKTLIK